MHNILIMLTDVQIWDLSKKMNIPLVFCDFQKKLSKEKLQYNKSYVINMQDALDKALIDITLII